MNTIAAWIIFTTIFTLGIKPIQIIPDNMVKGDIHSFLTPTKYFLYEQGLITGDLEKEVIIEDIYTDSLADKAGVQSGNTLLRVDDIKINTRNVEKTLKDHIGKTFELTYEKNGEVLTKSVTCPQDDCILGIAYTSSINPDNMKEIKFPILTAMKYGAKELRAQTRMTL
jgi:C-terminal processing protease CtpA/Prc